MKKTAIVLLAAAAVLTTGCDKLKSRDQLNQGVQAYKNAKYPEAVEHFKKSVALDPANQNGRLYLGTAYFQQYIPGADSPENKQFAKAAKDEFMKVLESHPNDRLALASIANLEYQQAQGVPDLETKLKRLDSARDWYLKLVQADPQNKEAYYTLAVIDWAKWYPAWTQARTKMGMKPEDPGPMKDAKVRAELREKYGPIIEDGIKDLRKSLAIDPNYDDAMAYLNLLIRERADLSDNKQEYQQDVATADQWVQKALETKKQKAMRAPTTGLNAQK